MTALRAFSPTQRIIHWLMAICIIAMLFVGIAIASIASPDYPALVTSHKTLGILLLLLVLLRIAVRLRNGAPPLPADLPAPMKLGAHLSHLAFYGLMIAMPLIGWAMVSAEGYPIVLAGGLRLPPIVSPDRTLHALLWDLHQALGLAFFALVLLHLAAAIFHALVRQDGVFAQMTVGSSERE